MSATAGRSRAALVLAGVVLAVAVPAVAETLTLQAARARKAILLMELDRAEEILGAGGDDADLAVERARLGLARGDCDGAAAGLRRPDLLDSDLGTELLGVALGCARGTAATVIATDGQRGVVVRLQDDEDRALVPLLTEAAAQVRAALAADLDVHLPSPIFIDLVRDQLTLCAATGLPEQAAQTTGAVAVAKWGRVVMLSPRVSPGGYPWLDTLAHELAHLAVARGTADRAPLWLQEGIAKHEETRWRSADPFDAVPSADAVAAIGLERGLGRPLDDLGPSIAMLPSPEQAQVAFAEVVSFLEYWLAEVGATALPELLRRIRDGPPGAEAGDAIATISGASLKEWDVRWRQYLAARPRSLPPSLAPGGQLPRAAELHRRVRLGELLAERGHHGAAAVELALGHELAPQEARVRAQLAAALVAAGDEANAAPLVEKAEGVLGPSGRWWSLHALLGGEQADPLARWRAAALSPLSPPVACWERPAPELPAEAPYRSLCEAARRAAR
ncbi:MAG: hypothetical protein HY744_12860 [Deltaproteobacteria bacterium]|nr:hypothetical protein [Deltaproteobacteria bacterium]